MDVIELLIDPAPVEGFDVVTTESVPGLPSNGRRRYIQAFTRVWKGKIPVTQVARQFNRCFEMILRVRVSLSSVHWLITRSLMAPLFQSICFKLRKMRPCVICNVQFTVDLPEEDEIQITVLGELFWLKLSKKPSLTLKFGLRQERQWEDCIKLVLNLILRFPET